MKLSILTTGGTIEKTYNEHDGSLKNNFSVLDSLLRQLRLPDIEITHIPVMNKDSLDMTDSDREIILNRTRENMTKSNAILILHGTDTMEITGEYLNSNLQNLKIPIVMTGAMRPYEFRDSDALQNVTEALLALKLASPGVYVVMHNRVLKFPGVFKDREKLHFTKD